MTATVVPIPVATNGMGGLTTFDDIFDDVDNDDVDVDNVDDGEREEERVVMRRLKKAECQRGSFCDNSTSTVFALFILTRPNFDICFSFSTILAGTCIL